MSKKVIDNTPITNFEDDWGGTYQTGANAGKEWGKPRGEVERVIKEKVAAIEAKNTSQDSAIAGKIGGVRVNNTLLQPSGGVVDITVPRVSSDISNTSNADAAQAGAVAQELNGVRSHLIYGAQLGAVSADGSEVALNFFDDQNDVAFSVNIPAAQDVGEVIYPVINATRLSPARMKLGDNIRVSWQYDCRSNQQEGSVTEYPGTVIAKVQLTNDSGTTTIKEVTLGSGLTAGHTAQTFTIDGSEITSSGTLKIIFTAAAEINGEVKSVQRTVTITVVSLSLSSTFDPSIGLAANNGYLDGDTITIPYAYSVPVGTTLKAWLDGEVEKTEQISGTSNSSFQIAASRLAAGRHNIQLIAIDEQGLLSNVVSLDLRKAGNTSDYLGLVMAASSDDIDNINTDMPLPYAYGSTGMSLGVSQFSSIELQFAVWNNSSTSSIVTIAVDNVVTQTITAGRTRQTLSQRFDEPGSHSMTITMGTCVWSIAVEVMASGSVTETITTGYVKNLSAVGRNNNLADKEEWGGVTTFTGLNYSSNGWIDDALLLTNGAKAHIELKPFADYSGDGNGIHQMGMTFEAEIMVSQVVERGAAIMYCLWDNDQNKAYDPSDTASYPRGIKVATDKASLLFGGVEEIHTTEKVQDSDGNFLSFSPVTPAPAVGADISSEGYYVKESNNVYRLTTDTVAVSGTTYYAAEVVSQNSAQDLYVIRPYGAEMNIAENKWMHLAFVIQPVSGTPYLLGMLYINGVLSRVNRFANDAITALDMRQLTPVGIDFDSDRADVRVRSVRYYRKALDSDQILSNYIATLHTAADMQLVHDRNDVAGTDTNNQATISRTTLIETKKRGVLTIVKSRKKLSDTVNSDLRELFENGVGKKEDFCADYIRWDPPVDANDNKIGDFFEARCVNIRIQGTSSVNYPYKNIRIYLAKTSFHSDSTPSSITVGSKTYNYNPTSKKMERDNNGTIEQFKGYPLRGSGNSMVQAVLCAKTDFVDSSLVMNTGGAHLFNDKMKALGLVTPPMDTEHGGDGRVRQAIDGIPCDLYAGTSESGPFTYFGQFVLNNEKSKSDKIFGMEGAGTYEPTCPIALEALENRYALTLFQSAGQSSSSITIGGTTTSFGGSNAENAALEEMLTNTFGKAFEFNYPEDTFWTQAEIAEQDKPQDCTLASDLQKNAIRRLMSFIYRSVKESNVNMSNPEYGDQNGWSATDKAKWHSAYFRAHVEEYFDVDYLCTYYIFTEYWASVDQRAKNILWRTWDGLKWFPTYYDGDTAMSIRNDAFMVYLYSVTRDTYDNERSKFAFEGHDSWLWCLLLANVEYGNANTNPIYNRLAACARAFRNQVSLDAMLTEFNDNMMWNWSERQYNYSQKLKYIDTMDVKYYPYTLTGNREAHRTQFLTERSALLDAQYQAGDYLSDTFTVSADRSSLDAADTLLITSGDLYYFGFRDVQNNWVVMPQRADAGQVVSIVISQELNATSGQSNVTGASKIRELDFTGMAGHINSVGMNLGKCVILEKLIINSRTVNGAVLSFGGTINLGNTTKLRYIDLTGQNGINNGQTGRFDLSNHSRLGTVKLSGTGLTTLILPEGAPITRLELPNTLGVLTLRNLPQLSMSNLTMDGDVWTGVLGLNFANCPNLNWITLLGKCTNAKRVRIEGISGSIRSSVIAQFIEGWNPNNPNDSSNLVFHGLNANGTNNNWPQFAGGVVTLIDVIDTITVGGVVYTFAQLKSFFEKCELTVNMAQYSDYIFNDEETDPCNVYNSDNGTGWTGAVSSGEEDDVYHYQPASGGASASTVLVSSHPLGYEPSGHIKLIHDRCVPVLGYVKNTDGGKQMHLTPLSKSDYTKEADGVTSADIQLQADYGQDVFLYVPKYYYKGVNDYRNAQKHLLLSSLTVEPRSSASSNQRLRLSELESVMSGKVLDISGTWLTSKELVAQSDYDAAQDSATKTVAVSDNIATAIGYNTYCVNVEGWKQIRFPGLNHPSAGYAFVDAEGKAVNVGHFSMNNNISGNPADFDNDLGDYIFLTIPTDAKYFYFSILTTTANLYEGTGERPLGSLGVASEGGVEVGHYAVLLTDSTSIEAIEPDWVLHQSELVGIYQGTCNVLSTNDGTTRVFAAAGIAQEGLRSIAAYLKSAAIYTQRGSGTSTQATWSYDAAGNPTALPSVAINGTAQDFFNLASVRTALASLPALTRDANGVVTGGGEYSTVAYETSKDMANLLMAWFGTRDIETIVGRGDSASYSPGSASFRSFGDSHNPASNTRNKMWGIEAWTASMYEWMDKGCLNTPSFAAFKRNSRNAPAGSRVDYYYNILQQDGKERRVKVATSNQATNVARVRFGRYCDIVASAYAGDGVYATGYACYQSSNGATGRVLGRSHYYASAYAGVAYVSTGSAASLSSPNFGGRLCFFGKFENEEDVL